MAGNLALIGYAGLIALTLPYALRVWYCGWVCLVAVVVGPAAVPLGVAMFLPVAILGSIRDAVAVGRD